MMIEHLKNILQNGLKIQAKITDLLQQEVLHNLDRILKGIFISEEFHLRNISRSLLVTLSSKDNNSNQFSIKWDEINGQDFRHEIDISSFEQELKFGLTLIKSTIKEVKKTDNYVVELSLSYALESRHQYIKLIRSLKKKKIRKNKEININKLYVCEICGYIIIDELSQNCPICDHSSVFFKEIKKKKIFLLFLFNFLQ